MVSLQGLAKRADLNGAVGRVTAAENEAEKASLADSLRVKVALCRGGSVSVKPDNLLVSRDTEWHVASINASIWEKVTMGRKRGKFIGDEDHCDAFVRSLWEDMFETPPPILLHPFHQHRAWLLNISGHKFFWYSLDAIGHHFALELRGGRWRVHQSFVRQLPGRGDMMGGYTAKQWGAAGENPAMAENEAYHRWGGGRELSTEEVGGFLDDLGALIREADELTREELLPQVCPPEPTLKHWPLATLAPEPRAVLCTQVPGWNDDRDTEHAVGWAAHQLARVQQEGVSVWPVDPVGGWHELGGEPLHVSIGGELLLTLSPARAATLTRPRILRPSPSVPQASRTAPNLKPATLTTEPPFEPLSV